MSQSPQIKSQSLIPVANYIGRATGIRVQSEGCQAYTDPGKNPPVIVIPQVIEGTDDAVPLIRGYLYHEAAHVRFTDFKFWNDSNMRRDERVLTNIIEDVRVERLMSLLYTGVSQDLKFLQDHIFDQKWFKDQPRHFLTYCLIRARGLPYSLNLQGPIIDRANNLLDPQGKYVKALKNVQDSYALACAILGEQSTGYSSEGQSTESTALAALGAKQDRETSEDSLDLSVMSAALGVKQDRETSEDNSDSKDSQALSSTQDQAYDQEEEYPDPLQMQRMDIGKIVQELCSRMSSCLTDFMQYRDVRVSSLSKDLCQLSSLFTSRFGSYIQGQILLKDRLSRHGLKLSASKLYKTKLGDGRIFLKALPKNRTNLHIHILLDQSGSMYGERQRLSMSTVKGLWDVASSYPSIKVDCHCFSGSSYFDLKPNTQFEPADGTNLGAALGLLLTRENFTDPLTYYVILIITDGETTDADTFDFHYESLKVDCIALSIESKAIETLSIAKNKNKYRIVNDIYQIPGAVYEMLKGVTLC